MISIQKRFLFIHVPKTGGNSIQNILSQYSEDEIVVLADHQDGVERFEVRNPQYKIHKHSTLSEYKAVLDPVLYHQLFKFAVIRNPWDRMISWYFSPHRGGGEWDRNNFIQLIQEVPTLEHYIKLNGGSASQGSRLKVVFSLKEKPWRHPLARQIDLLMRFEHLNQDFAKVCRKIGIPVCSLPVRNQSTRGHYSQYYDEELIEMVSLKFKDEIALGSYKFYYE